jgi:hypothetical protein
VFLDSLNNLPFCTSPGDTMYVDFNVGQAEPGKGMRIYPNPARDYLVIESNRMISEACLYDFLGRMVISNNGMEERVKQLPVSDLTPGIYILRVIADGSVETRKIVKE